MIRNTLIYVERDGKYLMLHRVKKQGDINRDKWIGVGGKFEPGETARECAAREMLEETGLKCLSLDYRAVVYFESDVYESEEMHLFTCREFTGEVRECDEGTLEWVDKREVYRLNIWEGDRIFLEKLAKDEGFFRLRLRYEGDRLAESEFL